MTIVVEDGTAKSDAQVYASVSFADAWHLARGITLWATLSTTEKEQALVRAANHLQLWFRMRWRGWRTTETQAMDWPRGGVPVPDGPSDPGYYSDSAIPIEVQQANAELAFKAAFEDLLPDIDRSSAVKREKVDVIEVEYQDRAPLSKRFQSIELLLAPFLTSVSTGLGSGTISTVRA